MRHKVRYTSILLTIIFCIIPVVCILMVHHLNITDTLSKMGSGSFGKSSSLIKIHDNINIKDLIQSVDNTGSRFAIYIDEVGEEGTVRSIYFNSRYVHIPMKSGRFFIDSDFTNDLSTAVVGKSREDEIYENAYGEQCVFINNTEYHVLGVIGYEQATILDDYIYLSLDLRDNVDSPLIIVDFLDSERCDLLSEYIMEQLENRSVNSELLSASISFSETIMPQIISARWFIGILFCCFICLLITSVQWINSQKQEMTIRMLVGASSKDIAILIAKKYLFIAVLSFFIGWLYCNTFYPFYTTNLIYGYTISIIFIFGFLVWSLYYFLHIDIQEALK